jgi:hypothetical protein
MLPPTKTRYTVTRAFSSGSISGPSMVPVTMDAGISTIAG